VNIARQIAKYEEKGFSREKAEINALMENAIFAIFQDSPDAFLLFGGATLVLFHESVRHSADLDLLPRGTATPTRDEIISTLKREVSPIAETLQFGELKFDTTGTSGQEGNIFVSTSSGQRLFRVDLTKIGSTIESEIETHPVESQSGESVDIKSPTKELLLLQKAEAFLLRRIVKTRDAYDIHVLLQKGAVLNRNLKAHLQDTMHQNEFGGDAISERIALVDVDRCTLELKPILPPKVYTPLEESEFAQLREAVRKLFEGWL
jgi:hypothetical protein